VTRDEPEGPALLIDYDAARRHFAPRVEARAERNARLAAREAEALEAHAAAERAKWLADLETWPAAFRRELRPIIEHRCKPDLVRDRTYGAAGLEAKRRGGRVVESYHQTFEEEVLANLRQLQRWRRERDTCRLWDDARSKLLLTLFAWGRRRIQRAELEPIAAERVEGYQEHQSNLLARATKRAAELEERLAAGLCTKGARKGQPLGQASRGNLERQLAQARAER
jgi:hypothetical protein